MLVSSCRDGAPLAHKAKNENNACFLVLAVSERGGTAGSSAPSGSTRQNELMSRVLGANPSAHVPVLPAAGSSAAALRSSCLHTSAPADERCRRLLPSWFRHVGELAVLAAGPKHQNKGSGCVISLRGGERRAV